MELKQIPIFQAEPHHFEPNGFMALIEDIKQKQLNDKGVVFVKPPSDIARDAEVKMAKNLKNVRFRKIMRQKTKDITSNISQIPLD